MIIERVLGNVSDYVSKKNTEYVYFEWYERNKKVMKKTSSSGEEIGLRLSEPLCDGDILFEDGERLIAASLTPCDLIRVETRDMREMGRVCFELGNRHLTLAIAEDSVRAPYDAPTFEYLTRLGFVCSRVTEKFVGLTEVRGHDHGEGHGNG